MLEAAFRAAITAAFAVDADPLVAPAQNDKFGPFSWVFLDPPYVRETEGLLGELCGLDVLSNCAVVVVEHDRRHRPAERVGCLFLTDRRQYGDTELSFFRSSGS